MRRMGGSYSYNICGIMARKVEQILFSTTIILYCLIPTVFTKQMTLIAGIEFAGAAKSNQIKLQKPVT